MWKQAPLTLCILSTVVLSGAVAAGGATRTMTVGTLEEGSPRSTAG